MAEIVDLIERAEPERKTPHIYEARSPGYRVFCPKCGWKGFRHGEACACYEDWAPYCKPWSPGPGCPSWIQWPCPRCGAKPEVVMGCYLYKVLSLKHPWAMFVMAGVKTIETRMWKTKYRGELLIHNSLGWDDRDEDPVSREFVINGTMFLNYGYKGPPLPYSPGCILGSVVLKDCRPMTKEDEPKAGVTCEPGRYAWILEEPRVFEPPVKMKGKLGLFEVPKTGDVQKAMDAMLAKRAEVALRNRNLDKTR